MRSGDLLLPPTHHLDKRHGRRALVRRDAIQWVARLFWWVTVSVQKPFDGDFQPPSDGHQPRDFGCFPAALPAGYGLFSDAERFGDHFLAEFAQLSCGFDALSQSHENSIKQRLTATRKSLLTF